MAEISTLESLLRRDRAIVFVGLAGVTGLAWVYLFVLAAGMSGISLDEVAAGGAMVMTQVTPWSVLDVLFTFLMWAIMMMGMMVPSAMPATLVYAGVVRKAGRDGNPVAPTLVFVAGYLAAWTLFSTGATAAQWGLEELALLSPMMVSTSPLLGAGLLIVAGVYQLTPAKRACLSHCRSPVQFIAHHWRKGIVGAFRMGLSHGFFCLGCCWALMLLLFVGGVMNLVWVAAITFFVLLEKILPSDRIPSWLAAAGLFAAGVALLVLGTR